MLQVCLPSMGMGNSDWSVLKAVYSEETVEQADDKELDNEFDTDTTPRTNSKPYLLHAENNKRLI